MKIFLILLSSLVLFSGCVSQPVRSTLTASGRPEVTIATADAPRVRAELIGEAVNYGYVIEQDTPYSLTMSRKLLPGEQLTAALFVGNSYSSNSRMLTYTIIPSPGSVRVVASAALRAQMPGGQVNTSQLDANNGLFNILQASLEAIKRRIETPSGSDAGPSKV